MLRDKWEYYTGKADAAVYLLKPFDIKVLKSDVHIYMDSDQDLQRADQKVAYQNQIVKYLEQVLRSINNRTFLIKNAIEWKKFTSGAIYARHYNYIKHFPNALNKSTAQLVVDHYYKNAPWRKSSFATNTGLSPASSKKVLMK